MLALTALITVFQTVLSGTLMWKMSAAYGIGDLRTISRLAGLGLEFALVMCLAVGPIAWAMRFHLVALSAVPVPYRAAALIVLPWLITQTILGGMGDTLGAVLIAHQRAGVTTLTQTGALMANSGFVIFGLMRGWQVWSLLLGSTVGVFAGMAGLYIGVLKVCGGSGIRLSVPAWPEVRPLLKYAAFLAIGQISMALRDQTDKVVLANLGSSLWTAWFGLASRLANLVLVACSFFYVPLVAASGALHAAGDWRGVRRIYDNAMVAVPLVTGAFVVFIASTYDRLLMMWVGRTVPQVGPILFILLAGNITAVVLTGAGTSVSRGIGRVSIETTYIVVCVVCNIVFKLVLTRLIGPIGTVVSSAASWALGSIVFAFLLHRAVDLPKTTIRAALMIPVMAVAILLTRLATGAIPASTTRWNAMASASGIGIMAVATYCILLIATRLLPMSFFRSALPACRDLLRLRIAA